LSRRPVIATLAIAVIGLMVLAGVILAVVNVARGSSGLSLGGRIAIVEIDGVIGDDRDVLDQLRKLRRDPSIKGYLVDINSPGGSVGPSQSIYQELRRLRTQDSLPVIAAISAVGASGGYYIALAADSIYALPGSITGSIGVIMEIPDASELMGKVGVRWQTVKSAEHKDVGSPFRPMNEGDRAILDTLVLDVYGQFVDVVSSERKLERAAVLQVADGRILSGRQAMRVGLIDRLGNREDALRAVGNMAGLGSDPKTVRREEDRPTLLDVLLGRGAAGVVSRLVAPLEPAGTMPRIKFVVPW
jgi:protease IV